MHKKILLCFMVVIPLAGCGPRQAEPAEGHANRATSRPKQRDFASEEGSLLAGLAGGTAHFDGVIEHADTAVGEFAAGLVNEYPPAQFGFNAGGEPGVQALDRYPQDIDGIKVKAAQRRVYRRAQGRADAAQRPQECPHFVIPFANLFIIF